MTFSLSLLVVQFKEKSSFTVEAKEVHGARHFGANDTATAAAAAVAAVTQQATSLVSLSLPA